MPANLPSLSVPVAGSLLPSWSSTNDLNHDVNLDMRINKPYTPYYHGNSKSTFYFVTKSYIIRHSRNHIFPIRDIRPFRFRLLLPFCHIFVKICIATITMIFWVIIPNNTACIDNPWMFLLCCLWVNKPGHICRYVRASTFRTCSSFVLLFNHLYHQPCNTSPTYENRSLLIHVS